MLTKVRTFNDNKIYIPKLKYLFNSHRSRHHRISYEPFGTSVGLCRILCKNNNQWKQPFILEFMNINNNFKKARKMWKMIMIHNIYNVHILRQVNHFSKHSRMFRTIDQNIRPNIIIYSLFGSNHWQLWDWSPFPLVRIIL